MNFLLTGATGFLGRRVATSLAAKGHQLTALVRRGSDRSALAGIVPDGEFLEAETHPLAQIFAHRSFDGILHFAACYGRRGELLSEVFEANTGFPLRLLENACHAGVPAFINAGTSLPAHLGVYALSKQQFSAWGKLLGEAGKISFIDLALEHFYGPDDSAEKFVTRIIHSCLSEVPTLALTEGRQRRDFIHVEDVVAAVEALVAHLPRKPLGYHHLGVGTGETVSIRELVEQVRLLTGACIRLDFGAVATRAGEPEELKADISALRALGWSPRVSLKAGLAQTIGFERRKGLRK